ncbi:hypothetical protein CERSUDRAFT_77365 [Gelatoporia subvermispora B]|uniref:Zn(2)-C6 fungal-type domain-containing protein n=1 Tax=Ceriporiopsis subvermispora (strain B) TaxID=914234 RepID=M2PA32_CERS8|nr:hypothetical protein CERSUDRAFT_77365 [Gelatoporia subvermispora B]
MFTRSVRSSTVLITVNFTACVGPSLRTILQVLDLHHLGIYGIEVIACARSGIRLLGSAALIRVPINPRATVSELWKIVRWLYAAYDWPPPLQKPHGIIARNKDGPDALVARPIENEPWTLRARLRAFTRRVFSAASCLVVFVLHSCAGRVSALRKTSASLDPLNQEAASALPRAGSLNSRHHWSATVQRIVDRPWNHHSILDCGSNCKSLRDLYVAGEVEDKSFPYSYVFSEDIKPPHDEPIPCIKLEPGDVNLEPDTVNHDACRIYQPSLVPQLERPIVAVHSLAQPTSLDCSTFRCIAPKGKIPSPPPPPVVRLSTRGKGPCDTCRMIKARCILVTENSCIRCMNKSLVCKREPRPRRGRPPKAKIRRRVPALRKLEEKRLKTDSRGEERVASASEIPASGREDSVKPSTPSRLSIAFLLN